jgi:diguanylate cyclase (GGDEF)-like protein
MLKQSVQEIISADEFLDVTFALVGGEDFMVLFPAMEPEAVFETCEEIRREIERRPVLSAAGTFHITVSIGVALRRETDFSFDSLYSSADRALYEAKSSGRNRVCLDESGPLSHQDLTGT